MKQRIAIMVAIAWLFALPGRAQLNVPPPARMSHSELKKLEHNAKTQEQFQAISAYYRSRERTFRTKAAQENAEWERRSQNVSGPSAKPPRPVDSARNLYQYYLYEADKAAERAAQYERSSQSHGLPQARTPF